MNSPALPALIAGLAILGGAGARFGAREARRLPPAVAAVVLSGFALTVALTNGLLLCLLAYVGLAGRAPAGWGHDWSRSVLRAQAWVPGWVGALAGSVAAVLIGIAVRELSAVVRGLRAARRTTRDLAAVDGLTVVADTASYAFAVPGRDPRVVVSSAMLRALAPEQRRVVLAHEACHLRHRHHRYAQAARLAAAAHPLLRPLVPQVDSALERWADVAAARTVGSRTAVAHAIAAAAVAAREPPRGLLGAGGGGVVDRVRFLLEPPRPRCGSAVVLASAAVLAWVVTGIVVWRVHGVIELSETAWRAGRP